MIPSQGTKAIYLGDGITKVFPFTFHYNAGSDVKVALYEIATNVTTVLENDFYVDTIANTVSYPGYPPGQEPAESDQPPVLTDDYKLIIYRETPITQEVNLGDKYPLNTLERMDDKAILIAQELAEKLDRTVMVEKGDDITPQALMAQLNNNAKIAAESAISATASQLAAAASASSATASETAAAASQIAAAASETNAASSASTASTCEASAVSAAQTATIAETNALAYKNAAAVSEANALSYKNSAASSEATAVASATSAGASEMAAKASETAAANSAAAAAQSASQADIPTHNLDMNAHANLLAGYLPTSGGIATDITVTTTLNIPGGSIWIE